LLRCSKSSDSRFGLSCLAAFAAQLGRQIAGLEIGNPDLCLAVFKFDRDAGSPLLPE
jgi:hypothetical protein